MLLLVLQRTPTVATPAINRYNTLMGEGKYGKNRDSLVGAGKGEEGIL